MNKWLLLVLSLIILTVSASAQSIVSVERGDGWQIEHYDDGTSAYSNHANYLRWDNVWIPKEWLNIDNGNWSYKIDDNIDSVSFIADDNAITIPKANTKFNLGIFKISPSLTYSKTALISNMVNVPTQVTFDNVTYPANTLAYLTFPYSVSQVIDYADEHNIKLGRWKFQAGKEHIDIFDDTVIEHTFVNESGENETYYAVSTLSKDYYAFKIVNNDIRIYFLKSEANKLSGNITFQLNSWTVGEGGNAWVGNSSSDNTTLNRDTNRIILEDAVPDFITKLPFDGNSGITAYDMNLTSNNNGILTNMNTGLDNGSSGWNSSGQFGNAISFDGINDFVNFGNIFQNFRQDRTIQAWIYLDDITSDHAVCGKFAAIPSEDNWLFFFDDVSYPSTRTDIFSYVVPTTAGSATWLWIESSQVIPNKWYHVTVVHKWGVSAEIYINGENDTQWSQYVTSTTASGSTQPFYVGNVPSGKYHNGLIDSPRIYNRALTNDEINLTMLNSMVTAGNLTTWYDSGTGNETYQIDVNATTITNSNYTVWYANNGTGSYTQLGGTLTGNNSLPITTKYQNTDVQVRLAGNITASPELIAVTFWSQTATGEDTTAPTYSGAGHNQTVAGLPTLFYIQYNDETALETNGQYIFSTNNTGAWVNESAINFTATPEWANVTKTLNSTAGTVVGYRWYGTDNATNAGDTPIYTLTVTSEEAAIEPEQVQFIFI